MTEGTSDFELRIDHSSIGSAMMQMKSTISVELNDE